MDIIITIFAVVEVVASAVLAWMAVRISRMIHEHNLRTEKLNQFRASSATVGAFNRLALSDDTTLRVIDDLYLDGKPTDIEAVRKRWAAFCALQTHHQLFIAKEEGFVEDDYAEVHQSEGLTLLLQDYEVNELVQTRGFDNRFARACDEMHVGEVLKGRGRNIPDSVLETYGLSDELLEHYRSNIEADLQVKSQT